MERGGPSAMLLTDLPDDCLLPVLLCLDVRGAQRFRRTCRRMDLLLKQSQNGYWLQLLRWEFGLHLQVWCLIWDVPRLAVLVCQQRLAGASMLSREVHYIYTLVKHFAMANAKSEVLCFGVTGNPKGHHAVQDLSLLVCNGAREEAFAAALHWRVHRRRH